MPKVGFAEFAACVIPIQLIFADFTKVEGPARLDSGGRRKTVKYSVAIAVCFAVVWPLASSAAVGGALNGYSFCEAKGKDTHAYVTPVFDMRPTGSTTAFEDHLRSRYALHDITARCFTLASKRDAQQFRTQRIEILHWDGWQRIVATQWTPNIEADDLHSEAPPGGGRPRP